jgi:methyl-accepting chemotaxis protein
LANSRPALVDRLLHFSLQGKITGGYGILFLLLLVVGYLGLQGIQRQAASLATLAAVRQTEQISNNLLRRDLQADVLLTSPADQAKATALLHAQRSDAAALGRAAPLPGLGPLAAAQASYARAEAAALSGHPSRLSSSLVRVLAADRAFRAGLDRSASSITRAASTAQHSSQAAIALVTVVSVLLTFLIGRFLARRIATPAVALAAAASRAAAGDLTREVPRITSGDEVEQLGRSFGQLMDSLRRLLSRMEEASQQISGLGGNIHGSAENISQVAQYTTETVSSLSERATAQVQEAQDTFSALEQLRRTIAEIGEGAATQATHVEQTSTLVSQMAQAIDEVATRAQAVAMAAAQSTSSAQEGGQVVDRAVAGMEELQETIHQGAERMHQLDEHSARIGEIVQVISDIADQTNLLALNAAIEAARAGENGRGFAVVAAEVRKLAERSSSSAKEIATLIATVQGATRNAVQAMESGTRGAGAAVSLATSAGRALHTIVEMIEQAAGQIQGISAATEELSASSTEVVRAVEAVAEISRQHARSTGEVAQEAAQVLRFVQELTRSFQEMSAAVDDISTTAALTSDNAAGTVQSAQQLSHLAGDLTALVNTFQR